MWTLMVTLILMSSFFVVAPFVELQFTANGLQCLSIHSFSEYLGWRSKEKTSRFLACLALVPTTLPLILLTLSARHNFQTAGISLGT